MSLVQLTDSLTDSLRASGQAVVVDFDLTLFGQVALFMVLLLILKPVLFDPMLKLFEEREKRIMGAKLQARKLDEGSAGALTKYESEMQKARGAGNAVRERLRADGAKTENEILAKVRESTAASTEAGRKKLAEEIAAARTALRAEASALSKELAVRVLGREVQP